MVDWPQGPKPGQAPPSNASPKPGGETDGYVYNDFNTVVNAFHYRSLVLMERIATVTGHAADQKFFSDRAALHQESYMKTFFDKKRGIFKDGESTDHASLHANMFALAFGLVPEKHLPSVATFVKSRGMACSVYGAQHLLDALYQAGEADYALSLMTADSLRSWRNMIRVGSSMTTEAWDEYFKPNLTWNHAWGSAPANITARKLMGIEPLEPAFRRFRISPQPGSLEHAAIKMPCIRGSIGCEISQSRDGWRMNVSIPGNAEAEIWLPAEFTSIHIDGQPASPLRIEKFAGGKRQVFELGSGVFEIVAKR
ncbi:MAG: alpha-L-rhamnosidase C-terminal domain-containing protein [Bacteroidia bacterium]